MVESESKLHKCFCDWGFGLLLLLFHGALIMTVLIMVEKSPHTDSFYIGSYSFNIKPTNNLPLVEVAETIQFQVIGTFSAFTRTVRFSNNTIETGLPSVVQNLVCSSPNVTKDLNVNTNTVVGEYTTWTITFPPRSDAIIIACTYEADLLFNTTKENETVWKFNYHLIDDSWSKMNGTVWGFSKIDVDLLLPFAALSNLTMSQDLYGQSASDNETTLYFKQDYLGLGRNYAVAVDFIPGSDTNKEHETKKILGIDWWIFVIAGGVVVVIIAAILITHAVKTRGQKKVLILERQ